jgi:hypothetical protein
MAYWIKVGFESILAAPQASSIQTELVGEKKSGLAVRLLLQYNVEALYQPQQHSCAGLVQEWDHSNSRAGSAAPQSGDLALRDWPTISEHGPSSRSDSVAQAL